MEPCPCGSNKNYFTCCGAFIENAELPPTPEALMRSRYTAYTKANIGYIIKTMKGKAAKHFDATKSLQWAKKSKWLGLTIIEAPLPNKDNPKKGLVEFIAKYELNGKQQSIHEFSEFHRQKGIWYYVNGIAK